VPRVAPPRHRAPTADSAMRAKAAMADALGINVNICGTDKQAKPWP